MQTLPMSMFIWLSSISSAFVFLQFHKSSLVKYVHSGVLFMNFIYSAIVVEVCTKWGNKHQSGKCIIMSFSHFMVGGHFSELGWTDCVEYLSGWRSLSRNSWWMSHLLHSLHQFQQPRLLPQGWQGLLLPLQASFERFMMFRHHHFV